MIEFSVSAKANSGESRWFASADFVDVVITLKMAGSARGAVNVR